LKLDDEDDQYLSAAVAPRAGAWIETCSGTPPSKLPRCRPPRGGVD